MSKTNNFPKIDSISEIEEISIKLVEVSEQTKQSAEEFYLKLLEYEDFTEIEKHTESLKRATQNMSKAMRQTYTVSDELKSRCKDLGKQRRKRKIVPTAPANTTIDLYEERLDHFAKGRNIYKFLLVCFIGSFMGVIVELIWCLLKYGYLESRSGLVYGPFNLLYGAGAVVLTGCLYKFRNHSA